jgi:hypothetical protein
VSVRASAPSSLWCSRASTPLWCCVCTSVSPTPSLHRQNDSDLNGINLEENHRMLLDNARALWCQRLHQGLQSIISLVRCYDER